MSKRVFMCALKRLEAKGSASSYVPNDYFWVMLRIIFIYIIEKIVKKFHFKLKIEIFLNFYIFVFSFRKKSNIGLIPKAQIFFFRRYIKMNNELIRLCDPVFT